MADAIFRGSPNEADGLIIPQGWPSYTLEEHAICDRLFFHQIESALGRMAPYSIAGLDELERLEAIIPGRDKQTRRLNLGFIDTKFSGMSSIEIEAIVVGNWFYLRKVHTNMPAKVF